MMDTHTPRIVGTFIDDELEPVAESGEPGSRVSQAVHPPLRAQRVFTEADQSYRSVVQPAPNGSARRGNIKQLPLHRIQRPAAQTPLAPPAVAEAAEVPVADDSAPAVSTVELAKRIQKVSTDLVVGAAVVTLNVAELAAHVFSLVGLVVLMFPGQFVHTCLLALYLRVSGQESNYGEAFVQCWNGYRNLLRTRWHIGPFDASLSSLVGFALLSPFVGLKFLELTSALVRLSR